MRSTHAAQTRPDVIATEGVEPQSVQQFADAVGRHLPVGETSTYCRKAFDPELKQYIQLIGDLAFWAPLAIPAAAFFTQLASRTADDFYSTAKEWLSKERPDALSDIAQSISVIKSKSGSKASVLVGLDVPDPNWGTALEIDATDPTKIILQLAKFSQNMERIHDVVSEAIADGHGPLGRGQVAFLDDGTIEVRWMSQKDYSHKAVKLRPSNDN